ncbi:siderophore-interacting protein [Devosia sp. MSA67]|uniref:Siderophore-interacting protein n=1 Tax=Devosia sediminis TaxID=2798801 RepID=A0A934J0Z7_9HYPH|nr:siderophore-interacting protein [Devosia sediminis]
MTASTDHPPKALIAEVRVLLADAAAVSRQLLDHMAEHEFPVELTEDGGTIGFLTGAAIVRPERDAVGIRVTAVHEAGLAYIKSVMASHLIEFATGQHLQIEWTGDGADATVFPNFREMTVTRVLDLSPKMRRISLSGQNLESFATGGLHIKLFVPPAGVTEPEWPVPGKDGLAIWPPDDKRPSVRTYTIRNIDAAAGTIEVDFVIHADEDGSHGVGAGWAMGAKAGDLVGVRGPIGRPVPNADWYLLVGDETALPAIARHLEAVPGSARGIALIEIDSESDQQNIAHPGIEVRWLYRNGAEPGTTTLLIDAVRAVEMPPQDTAVYAFAGVEEAAFTAIRHHWLLASRESRRRVKPWGRSGPHGHVGQISRVPAPKSTAAPRGSRIGWAGWRVAAGLPHAWRTGPRGQPVRHHRNCAGRPGRLRRQGSVHRCLMRTGWAPPS